MAKVIVVEEAVHVGAKHAARCAHGAVCNGAGNSLAHDLRKRARSRRIESFAHVDFIAFETDFRTEAKAKKLGSQAAMNTPHRLLHTKYRSNWQETESPSGTWLSLILDPIGIFNGT